MSAIVISAFPGVGKSYFTQNEPSYKCIDSDSSLFHWIHTPDGDKVPNPEFPANYIEHIKENLDKQDVIFVSSHADVREALKEANINYFLMYPMNSNYMKSLWLVRLAARDTGINDEKFVKMIDDNWDSFINTCAADDFGIQIQLTPSKTYIDKEMVEQLILFNKYRKDGKVDITSGDAVLTSLTHVSLKPAHEHAMDLVREYTINHLDKTDKIPDFQVYIVWQVKALQNWKFLLSTTLPDKMYYEVTYNGDKEEWYLDAYVKLSNETIRDRKVL